MTYTKRKGEYLNPKSNHMGIQFKLIVVADEKERKWEKTISKARKIASHYIKTNKFNLVAEQKGQPGMKCWNENLK